jgi:predicted transcriptional regulator
MDKHAAEEYSQSIGQIGNGFMRQVMWAREQGVPETLGMTIAEWVTKYVGYPKLPIPERREAVAQLTAEGYSRRETGEILGVTHTTVERDLNSGTNVPKNASKRAKTGTNVPPPQELIEQAKAEAHEEARETYEAEIANLQVNVGAFEAEIANLQINAGAKLRERDRLIQTQKEQIEKQEKQHREELAKVRQELVQGPPPTDFAKEIGQLTGPLVKFIQHDNLVNMLIELESQKEDRVNDWDVPELERVIHALLSLSKRAQSWAERLIPMNDKWKNRIHSHFEEGNTL